MQERCVRRQYGAVLRIRRWIAWLVITIVVFCKCWNAARGRRSAGTSVWLRAPQGMCGVNPQRKHPLTTHAARVINIHFVLVPAGTAPPAAGPRRIVMRAGVPAPGPGPPSPRMAAPCATHDLPREALTTSEFENPTKSSPRLALLQNPIRTVRVRCVSSLQLPSVAGCSCRLAASASSVPDTLGPHSRTRGAHCRIRCVRGELYYKGRFGQFL